MKPIVLAFIGTYLPGYRGGGPTRTIANLVDRLGDEFDFRIVTMDRDLGDRHAYKTVRINEWNTVGKAQVFYAGPKNRSLRQIARLLRETPHDLLYLNGFFNPVFTLQPILARRFGRTPQCPAIIAPRGEFSEGALSLKRWKKSIFIKLTSAIGLFDDVIWHASTVVEAADIHRAKRISHSAINVAINVAAVSEAMEMEVLKAPIEGVAHEFFLRVCFLSRIAPMKNLVYALKVLARMKIPIQFSIYGPKESSAYWGECEALIADLPAHIKTIYWGSVEPSRVRQVIAQHDVFFVPTRGENFGHVFMEAFSAGVPVLVSDKTPWRNLKERGLGWDLPLDKPEEFVRALEEVAKFDRNRRTQMRASCIKFASESSESEHTLMMNRRLFLDAIEKYEADLK